MEIDPDDHFFRLGDLCRYFLMNSRQFSIQTLIRLIAVAAVAIVIILMFVPKPAETFSPEGYLLKGTNELPPCSVYWFRDSGDNIVSGFVAFGENRPQIMISHQHGDIHVPSIDSARIPIPRDGFLYVLDPSLKLQKTDAQISDVAADWKDYANWAITVNDEMIEYQWR